MSDLNEFLTEHFQFKEFFIGNTDEEISEAFDTYGEELYNRAKRIATFLEVLRKGESICITSGYRSKRLNEKVGGILRSDHLSLEAVDIYAKHYIDIWTALAAYVLGYKNKTIGYTYLSHGKSTPFIHISFGDRGIRDRCWVDEKFYKMTQVKKED